MSRTWIVSLSLVSAFALAGCASDSAATSGGAAGDGHAMSGKMACPGCAKGTAGETMWCEHCKCGFVGGEKIMCKGCYDAKTGGPPCPMCTKKM